MNQAPRPSFDRQPFRRGLASNAYLKTPNLTYYTEFVAQLISGLPENSLYFSVQIYFYRLNVNLDL